MFGLVVLVMFLFLWMSALSADGYFVVVVLMGGYYLVFWIVGVLVVVLVVIAVVVLYVVLVSVLVFESDVEVAYDLV